MTVLEKEIEAKLVKIVKDAGGLCLKWVCPGWAGVPDRICLLPGGRVIFVELKRPKGGVLSARQKWWAEKLRALCFEHYFIYNEAGLAFIKRYRLEKKVDGYNATIHLVDEMHTAPKKGEGTE